MLPVKRALEIGMRFDLLQSIAWECFQQCVFAWRDIFNLRVIILFYLYFIIRI